MIMESINPCNCGGLPYMSPYIDRQYDELYIVRCMLCGSCGSLEWTDDEALEEWNKRNTKYETVSC